jgi:D-alanine transaminase
MQFADGVYEVILFYKNKLIDNEWHLDRLFRSLGEINIKLDLSYEKLSNICLELCKRNNLQDASIYIQITRGATSRNQLIPVGLNPTIIVTVSPIKLTASDELEKGYSAITLEDIRWQRCDIKSISLLASSLTKQKAIDMGYSEAIFIRNNIVTECSFSNLFIVDNNNNLVTKNLDNQVLAGITRRRIIALAKEIGIAVIERSFSSEELIKSKEAFATSTTLLIRPLTKINDTIISNGKCGQITRRLIDKYQQFLNT